MSTRTASISCWLTLVVASVLTAAAETRLVDRDGKSPKVGGGSIYVKGGTVVDCDAQGKARRATLLRDSIPYTAGGHQGRWQGGSEIQFNDEGGVVAGTLLQDAYYTVALRGTKAQFVGGTRIYFDETGRVYKGTLKFPFKWKGATYSAGVESTFVENALVASSAAGQADASGTWKIVANGREGTMNLATLAINLDGIDEAMANYSLGAGTGAVHFERPRVAQAYNGTLRNGKMTGTFTQEGAGAYQWQASPLSPPALRALKPTSPGLGRWADPTTPGNPARSSKPAPN